MRTFILHIPVKSSCDFKDLKEQVIEENLKVLQGEQFPATVFVNVQDLIGDPDVFLSADLCEKLEIAGRLQGFPILDALGIQVKLGGQLCWHYTWTSLDFRGLAPELLRELAWDLRRHPNFIHITTVDDSPQESLDVEAPEEYDSSTDDEPVVEPDSD